MSDVLLLHPGEQEKTFCYMPPLGMAWITSFLESKGISTTLIDLQVYHQNVDLLLQINKPRIVGIGGTTHSRFESFAIARQVKLYDPAIKVLYGGPHATFTAEDTLRHIPEIDIIVRGEGENTAFKVANCILSGVSDLTDISGISFRRDGGIVHNPDAERISDLDTLPFPYRDPGAFKMYTLKLDYLNVPAASVMSSRGCPINCSFCSASTMFGKQLTFRSPGNVVDEIEMLLKEHSYKGIKFFDSTLTLNRNHIEGLCDEIKRRRLSFPWECEIRVNGMSYDLLRTMRNAGCYYVDFGVESASPSVIKAMHKGITMGQVQNVFRWTKELGIFTKVFFTFGHYSETIENAYSTIEFMEKYSKYITVAAIGVGIRVYPGTEVEHFAKSNGSLSKDFSWSTPFTDNNIEFLDNDPLVPVLVQPRFGQQEFFKIEERLVRFWLKNPLKTIDTLRNQIKPGRVMVFLKLIRRFIEMHFIYRKATI
jgi:anaerobic magnesium-protoporphyrin IX monomethyl ester cyclase